MPAVWRPTALSLLIAAAALLVLGAGDARAQGSATVTVGDFFFCESDAPPGACATTIDAGGSVVWDYAEGTVGHTVTHCGDSCDDPTEDPLFDSGGIDPGGTFSFTFQEPGTYLYLCEFHPVAMRASVVVREPATPTATQTPTAAPVPTPTAEPPATETPEPTVAPSPAPVGADDDDDGGGGVSAWWFVLAGVVVGGVLLAGGIAFRRLRG